MRLLNRLSVLLFGLTLSAAGAVVLAHRMGLWSQPGNVLLPSDALLGRLANRTPITLVAVDTHRVTVWAGSLLPAGAPISSPAIRRVARRWMRSASIWCCSAPMA